MPDSTSGSGLLDAARAAGVQIREPGAPRDRTIEANGLSIHALDWGNEGKPPLVLLHGFAQQAHSWDFVALGVRDLCYVISVDLRGHGDSAWPEGPDYLLAHHVGDLGAVVSGLGLESPIICGLSLGGRVAFKYTAEHPGVPKGLIVVDVGPAIGRAGRDRIRRFVEAQQVFASFDELVAFTRQYTRSRRTEEQVRGSLRNAARELPDGRWTWKYDPRLRGPRPADPSTTEDRMWEALRSIRCPTMFVRGGESDILSAEALERMVAAVPGSEAATIEGAGHLVPGDRPAAFVEAIRPFLAKLVRVG